MVFKKSFYNFLDVSISILASKTVFNIYCQFFSIYLAIKGSNMTITSKNKTKNRVLINKISEIKIFKNLPQLLRPNFKGVKKIIKRSILQK